MTIFELLVVLLLLSVVFLFIFIYFLYFTRIVKNKLGRFASSIDAQSFAFSNNLKLIISHTGTRIPIAQFGIQNARQTPTILLYYNDSLKIFSPQSNHRSTTNKFEYTDYFYESLETITQRDRMKIVSEVRWYFINNFYKMRSFYQILFNIRPLKPFLPFLPQNILPDPENVLLSLPDYLKIGAKLTLMEIDSLRGRRIGELHSHAKKLTKNEKISEKKLVILRKLLTNQKRQLSTDEKTILGEDLIHSLQKSFNPIQFIESQIEQINIEFLQLGSGGIGKCRLHALGMKLIGLFAADFANIHLQGSHSNRLIFYFEKGKLNYYTTLYSHQYPVLKFARKIGSVSEEILFLQCFNLAKYGNTHGTDTLEFLRNLLRNKRKSFCLKTNQFILNNESIIQTLLL